VNEFFFIKSGAVQFVLPEFDHLPYINIEEHNHFGFVDIVASSLKNNFHINDWYENYYDLKRDFSIRASKDTQVFYLTAKQLESMNELHPDDFKSIFGAIRIRYNKSKAHKNKIEKECRFICRTDPNKKYTLQKDYHFDMLDFDNLEV